MFNWFKKKSTTNSKMASFIDAVRDVVNSTAALTGRDLFGFMLRERKYNTLQKGLNLSAVHCALSLYTSSTTSLPRNVMAIDVRSNRATRRVVSTDNVHPAIRIFLHYASPSLNADTLINLITNDVLVDGNFYALRELDSQGRTYRLNYVHPSRIPKGNIRYSNGTEKLQNGSVIPKDTLIYRIETGDYSSSLVPEAIYVLRDQIVHIQSTLPDVEGNRGYGIVENAARSFDFYENSEEYGNRFYKNGTNNQSFLTTDQVLGPDVLKRLEQFFEKNPEAPLEEAFKTRILDRGVKPVNVTIPLNQLQFIETRAFSVEDIARWFRVPPELLHSRMGSKGASGNIGELINLFVQFGVGPLLTSISNQLKSELLPLSSQPLYKFEFERIYLYRTVINEFSQAIRNLFEIGVLDRSKIADMLGVFIDPADKMNTQRYVPTNLMTVGHSLALETKADTANELLTEQVRAAALANDNYVSPTDMLKMQSEAKEVEADTSDDQDESPDEQNLDKRIRTAKNAFSTVLNGLHNYYAKVYDQKKEKHGENVTEFANAMATFTSTKFLPLVRNTVTEWEEIISDVSPFTSTEELINLWVAEGYDSIKGKLNETGV